MRGQRAHPSSSSRWRSSGVRSRTSTSIARCRIVSGGGAAEPEPVSDVGKARESGVPTKGAVLVANPQRFCSRNPFARAVKDLNRFGLQGPVQGGDLSADTKAQMLPVRLPACASNR